jgi:hypothetical protein
LQKKYNDSKSSPNNVTPLNRNTPSSTSETSGESLLSSALTNSDTEDRLKKIVEAAVFDVWAKTRLLDIKRFDDPFDAIYISELRADPIVSADIERISTYANIIDLSDTINFEDDWED